MATYLLIGGIGANREHPAEFLYDDDDLMMNVPLEVCDGETRPHHR